MGAQPNDRQAYVYTYDANGNRVNLHWPGPPGPNTQGLDYTYDRENRLIAAQAYQINHRGHRVDREITRLFYDGLGRRLAKEYDPNDGGGGVKRTEYVLDGLDPVAEYEMWNGQRVGAQRCYARGGRANPSARRRCFWRCATSRRAPRARPTGFTWTGGAAWQG